MAGAVTKLQVQGVAPQAAGLWTNLFPQIIWDLVQQVGFQFAFFKIKADPLLVIMTAIKPFCWCYFLFPFSCHAKRKFYTSWVDCLITIRMIAMVQKCLCENSVHFMLI